MISKLAKISIPTRHGQLLDKDTPLLVENEEGGIKG